jgi:hypothetical protein
MKKEIIIKATGERASLLYGEFNSLTVRTYNPEKNFVIGRDEVVWNNWLNRILYPDPVFLDYFEIEMDEWQKVLGTTLVSAIAIVSLFIIDKLCQ